MVNHSKTYVNFQDNKHKVQENILRYFFHCNSDEMFIKFGKIFNLQAIFVTWPTPYKLFMSQYLRVYQLIIVILLRSFLKLLAKLIWELK